MNWQDDQVRGKELLARLSAGAPDFSFRIALLAAHPDDETIGASSLLARYPTSRVVYLTDGAPRDGKLWPADMRGSREEYAAVRQDEALKALSHAGVSDAQMFWLGGVDQEAIYDARRLASKLAALLRHDRADVLITHPYEGGHPDHDCAALVARMATEMLGREAPKIVEMTSYHARNGSCVTGEFLNEQSSIEIELPMSEADRERKRKMMDEYNSQRLVLENFPIISERFRIAPDYDFSQPPHEGKLWYECMRWEMTGARWRELAGQALAPLKESSCA
jgi:LmbE family N-acetylglucosaminyl deacetylase